MDIVRRNTDYAIRAMVHLARRYNDGAEPVSTRKIARDEGISYQLACKLMQKLHDAKLVDSKMGPKGGFSLKRSPEEITLKEIIETIQGPVSLNRCLLHEDACVRQSECTVSRKLSELQNRIGEFLDETTLADLCLGETSEGRGSEND